MPDWEDPRPGPHYDPLAGFGDSASTVDGEVSVPYPYFYRLVLGVSRFRCRCGRRFWSERGYERHYRRSAAFEMLDVLSADDSEY